MKLSLDATYNARVQRAQYLKTIYPFAAEILAFYGRICTVQLRLSRELQRVLPSEANLITAADAFRERIDVDLMLPFVKKSLEELLADSPAPLAEYIREFLRGSRERWAVSLQKYVTHGGTDEVADDSREELLAHVVIEPYAEFLAANHSAASGASAGNMCPKCAARPVVGLLRIEGDGGKRFLLCAFCGTEWEFRRIYCAYCGETREQSLPVFVAEKFAHIRVEGCDTCRHCIRTVDLTKDGNAIPTVDDLAAIPLALWAEEYGYERIHGNLLGT
jgi:formate dehydrogenase accessory protein FdhE